MKIILVNAGDEGDITVQVSPMRFYVTDDDFKCLHGLEVKEFILEFLLLLKRNQLRTLGSEELPKTRKRSQYKHTRTFWEEVELLRNLHPEKGLMVRDNEMLNTAAKEWRRRAETALNVKEGHLGGLLKEAISVACLSRRCFLWAQSISKAYAAWKLKNQTNNKVNRMLFVQLPGLRNEERIFQLLTSFRSGELSKLEFNDKLKEAKVSTSRGAPAKRQAVGNEDDIGHLKRRNALLEARIMSLQREVADLRNKQGTPESPAVDVYAFQGSDDEDTLSSFSSPTHSLEQVEDDDEDMQSIERGDEEESDESMTLLLPTMTYSRSIGKQLFEEESTTELDDKSGRGNEVMNERDLLETFSRLESENEPEVCLPIAEEESSDGARFFSIDEFANLRAGMPVWAIDDGEWFKAKVVKKEEGEKVKIHYIGYGNQYDQVLGIEEVKTYCFAVGEKVKARWEDGHFYRGKVQEVKEKGYTILFEDGIIAHTEEVIF